MAYFSQTDIEEYTGFNYTDAKNAGVTMNATQWATLCSNIVDYVTQTVNRWCNVESFESHEVTEYHDGKGAAGDDGTYLEWDITFFLREYATGVSTVYIDGNSKTATIDWATRWERSTATAGDYEVATRNELTTVKFHNNYPSEGTNNIKIVYYAGYPSGSSELNEIKLCCLRMASNILSNKKKIQEALTVRGTDVRDYAPMFDTNDELLTDEIKRDLAKYRRYRLGGEAWD